MYQRQHSWLNFLILLNSVPRLKIKPSSAIEDLIAVVIPLNFLKKPFHLLPSKLLQPSNLQTITYRLFTILLDSGSELDLPLKFLFSKFQFPFYLNAYPSLEHHPVARAVPQGGFGWTCSPHFPLVSIYS